MKNILVARLQQLHQYNSNSSAILWEDPTPKRWQDIYGKLEIGSSCIFLSEGRLLIGDVQITHDGQSVQVHNVRETPLQNDNFLRIHAVHPEVLSRMKANFPPFLSPVDIDVNALLRDAQQRNFISFYLIKDGTPLNSIPGIRNNDRIITIENDIFKNFGAYQNGALVPLSDSEGLFNVKGQSLQHILQIHRGVNRPNAKRSSNNVGYVENIIAALATNPIYKFRSFNEYYNIIHNKRLYLGIPAPDEGESDDSEIELKITNDMKASLNTILYGPPGTGKTFSTINKAVAIVNPDFDIKNSSREQLKAEYKRLSNLGFIEFTTFHQSLSYEDFIEGIKPVMPKLAPGEEQKEAQSSEQLRYQIEDGIFKLIADKARSKLTPEVVGFSIPEDEFEKAQFYKMSLGSTQNPDDDEIYRYCIDNGYIALGWGGYVDYTGKTEAEVNELALNAKLQDFERSVIKKFIHYLKKGNYVIISYGNYFLRAIGRITGDYEYNPDEIEYPHFRKVEWLLKDENIPVEQVYDRQFSQQSLYKLDKNGIKKDFFVKATKQVSLTKAQTLNNYVLIIDEVNRGNVSQIFGELITLIEEDKREGMPEELPIVLPYSKKRFTVPNNLYIVGTMNTADRSVEALDTALRRRFSFEFMPPDYSTFSTEGKDKSIGGISLKNLLSTINERIRYLLDEDHEIGHSYFCDLNDDDVKGLTSVFKNKIIPLLKEYFYNDYEKIQLVLGDKFVATGTDAPMFASKQKEDFGKTTFTFAKLDDGFDIIGALKSTLNATA